MSNNVKKLAIIIPTYNRKLTVKKAIDSVLNQTYPHIKCIVVDDCSEDDTYEELSSSYQEKITIFRMDKNSGQSACRNLGAKKAETEFISFLDSDDFIYENAVSSRMDLIKNSDSLIPFGLFKTPSNRWEKLIKQKKKGEKLSLDEYIKNRSWCNNN
ncbi:MAG TPA: glycosyltransferase family A protein, partial [Victivallales bacterium]|nr:glycosyltransferase family A protein [Victivallales bacterium]